MADMFAGTVGVFVFVFLVVLAVLWTILPFAIFRVRRESIETTKLLTQIRNHLVGVPAVPPIDY